MGECLLNKWLLQKLGGHHYLVQKCIIYNYRVDEGKCLYEGKAKKQNKTLASPQACWKKKCLKNLKGKIICLIPLTKIALFNSKLEAPFSSNHYNDSSKALGYICLWHTWTCTREHITLYDVGLRGLQSPSRLHFTNCLGILGNISSKQALRSQEAHSFCSSSSGSIKKRFLEYISSLLRYFTI